MSSLQNLGRRLSSINIRKMVVGGQVVEISDDDDSSDDTPPVRPTKGNMPKMPEPTEKNLTHSTVEAAVLQQQGRRPSSLSQSIRRSSGNGTGGGHRRQSLFGRKAPAVRKPPIQSILRVGQQMNRAVMNFRLKTLQIDESKNEVEGIERVQDLPPDLIDDVWFTEDEIYDMKQEMNQLAAAIDMGETDVDSRGLENRTEEGNWKAYKARMDATNAVLDEQDKQMSRRVKIQDEDIRKVYLEVSEPSLKEAKERGESDEKIAMEFLVDTKKEYEDWKEKMEDAEALKDLEDVMGPLPSSPTKSKSKESRRISFATDAQSHPKRKASILKKQIPAPPLESPSMSSPVRKQARKKSWFVRAQQQFGSK